MDSDEFTLQETMVDVGNGHKLYAQLWGAKDGEPMIFLHGGPGSGCNNGHKGTFDPGVHKVLFFDQRGSGKSLPKGELKNNNTDAMIEDINKLADKFGFDKFTICGGSWGSTLALAYAIKNPKRVKNLVIRGIFTSRRSEIEFLDTGGFAPFFPEAWERFVNSVPEEARDNPSAYHQEKLFGNNKEDSKKSAYEYSIMESTVSSLDDRKTPDSFDDFDPTGITIEVHFIMNNCFLEEAYIMNNAHKLTMPVHIIQGRYDSVCPPVTAYELHQKLPNSRLYMTTAGHSGNDRGNWDVARAIQLELASK